MSAIAGVNREGKSHIVTALLEKMKHRGNARRSLFEKKGTTYGISWNVPEEKFVSEYIASDRVADYKGAGHCAWAEPVIDSFILYRDEIGVAPLYYGWDKDEVFYFASEVKALLPYVSRVYQLPPGTRFDGQHLHSYYDLEIIKKLTTDKPDLIAKKLKALLESAVADFIRSDDVGSWLSGGLDSSTICAIAARQIPKFQTFAAGLKGAPDLECAREVADFIKSDHHEVIVTVDDMVAALPEVIYHLESFDALLVRSTITNFLVAKRASEFVSEVFSGEGGDELFAGYEYLKSIPEKQLPSELVKLTNSLHNTALQRVDRCSSAHGTTAHVVFLHPEIVKFAFAIPLGLKLNNGVEKWILRKAIEEDLPEKIINRPKAKFWEGAGVQELISAHADKAISDKDFSLERKLKNGWILNTREELLYYRIFKNHFGDDIDLEWMGRTGGSPVA
jgi:asparagine synthase (glutamine-hydrolysing)